MTCSSPLAPLLASWSSLFSLFYLSGDGTFHDSQLVASFYLSEGEDTVEAPRVKCDAA